jgi:ABC-type sulfate transport system permease component
MKAMGHTMSFEAGREFERTYNPQGGLFSLLNLVQIGIPVIFLILILILVFNQMNMLSEINGALQANSTTLESIKTTLETSVLVGKNAIVVP